MAPLSVIVKFSPPIEAIPVLFWELEFFWTASFTVPSFAFQVGVPDTEIQFTFSLTSGAGQFACPVALTLIDRLPPFALKVLLAGEMV